MDKMSWTIVSFLVFFPLQSAFAGLPLASVYTELEAQKASGPFIEKRRVTEDVDVYIHENESYLLWTQGVQKHHIYRIVKKKVNAKFDPPPMEGFLKLVDDAIDRYAKSNDKPVVMELRSGFLHRVYPQSKEQYELMSLFPKEVFLLMERKYGDYDLREAQYFHFPGNRNDILRLFTQIQKIGLLNFVQARAIKRLLNPEIMKKLDVIQLKDVYLAFQKCINSFEEERAQGAGYSLASCEPNPSALSEPVKADFAKFISEAKGKWYFRPNYGVKSIGEEHFKDTKDFRPPRLYLTHGTYSQKIPNIIQLGGLASIDYAKSKGVFKSTGGEISGERGLDADKVSFYVLENDRDKLGLGYGPKEGFEYPVAFVVGARSRGNLHCYNAASEKFGKMSNDELEKLLKPGEREIKEGPDRGVGTIPQERTVPLFFPIECIDYVFTPPFAVEEVTEILREHKLNFIQVLPFPASSIKGGST